MRRQSMRAAAAACGMALCLSLLSPDSASASVFVPTSAGEAVSGLGPHHADGSLATQGMGTGISVRTIAPTASAASTTAGEPPMGLMVQLSTLQGTPTATLKGWLEHIRIEHHDPSKPGYINAIVLQDIADKGGALYLPYLDVIAPYLPGGATPVFAQAYVGTVDLPWTGSGSKYIEGIESSAFRTQNTSVSVTAAKAFKARYPKTTASWYITYEANMAGFWDASIEGAYRSYICALMNALSGVTPNRAYLWSPAFWTMYANEPGWTWPGLKSNLTTLFANLPTRLTLAIQDFVGQSGGTSTKESAAAWVGYLKQNWSPYLTKVQMNAEQFQQSGSGSVVASDATETPLRENYYASKGIELGPAWEIRFWYQRGHGS